MKRSVTHCVWLALALGAGSAWALPERPVSVGLGLGVPDLVSAQADVVVLPPRWQIGLGFGLDGGLAGGLLRASDRTQTKSVALADGNNYNLDITMTPKSVVMWSPFVRFYPTKGDFYFQLTWAFMSFTTALDGVVREPTTGTDIGGLITGSVTFVQQIPTLSIGHVFHSKAFFVNVRLGTSFLFTSSTTATIIARLPDMVGGSTNEQNQAAIAEAKANIESSVNASAERAKANVVLIPSLVVSFGIIL